MPAHAHMPHHISSQLAPCAGWHSDKLHPHPFVQSDPVQLMLSARESFGGAGEKQDVVVRSAC